MIFALSCARYAKTPASIPPNFDWQGHRGARGLVPENSIPAFLKALEYPYVTTLELDLAVSKDHQLIVSHEPWFNPSICRLPNGDSIRRNEETRHLIYQMDVATIRTYDCGSLGNPRFPEQQKQRTHKPTLRELVETVRAQRPDRATTIQWNIEIKSNPDWDGLRHPPIDSFAQLVLDELTALDLLTKANVQSFDVRPLQYLHQKAPTLRLALLVENVRGLHFNLDRLGFKPDIYSPYFHLITRKTVRRCHQKGIKIIPWTVNDTRDMQGLVRMGVDGIITDYPDRARW